MKLTRKRRSPSLHLVEVAGGRLALVLGAAALAHAHLEEDVGGLDREDLGDDAQRLVEARRGLRRARSRAAPRTPARAPSARRGRRRRRSRAGRRRRRGSTSRRRGASRRPQWRAFLRRRLANCSPAGVRTAPPGVGRRPFQRPLPARPGRAGRGSAARAACTRGDTNQRGSTSMRSSVHSSGPFMSRLVRFARRPRRLPSSRSATMIAAFQPPKPARRRSPSSS